MAQAKQWSSTRKRHDATQRQRDQTRNTKERLAIAERLKGHRNEYFREYSYTKNRGFKTIQRKLDFNVKAFVRKRIPKGRPAFILDPGAGFIRLSADLKKTFGNRVFVTTVNLRRPNIPKEVEEILVERINRSKRLWKTKYERHAKQFLKELRAAVERAEKVDELRISSIEKLKTDRKYDIIFDIYGALTYAFREKDVLEKYLSILQTGGVVVTPQDKALAKVLETFGRDSEIAKRTGYYFETIPLSRKGDRETIGLVKRPVPKG